jgi:hypothetical protein
MREKLSIAYVCKKKMLIRTRLLSLTVQYTNVKGNQLT